MNWPYHSYILEGRKRQISDNRLIAILKRANILESKRFPVVLTLKHFSKHVRISFKLLYAIMKDGYSRTFKIKKRSSNESREIHVPSPKLGFAQRWILKCILDKVPSSIYCYSYEKGISIKDCASQHIGCTWLLKFDIKNFFPNITEKHIYHIFRQFGYGRLLSFEFAMLCTVKKISLNRNTYANAPYNYMGYLPQGASTSPKLSNLVMQNFDNEMGKYALANNLVYTRYADDIHLSTSEKKFNRERISEIMHFTYNSLRKYGFTPNIEKTHICPPGSRKIVLGLVVGETGVYLPKKMKKRLELHYYHFLKDSERHYKKWNFHSVYGMYNYIRGVFNYAKLIEPNFCHHLEKKYGELNCNS